MNKEYIGTYTFAQKIGKHPNTVIKWIVDGIKRGNKVIKLKAVWIGGRRYTTWKWYEEFIRELNDEVDTARDHSGE